MAGVKPIWGRTFPAWSKPAIDALKKLDEADAVKGKALHDGRFLGIDLTEVAELYLRKDTSHQPGFVRLFEAAAGLHRYLPGASQEKVILNSALFEGARAMLLSRPASYDALPGFKDRYINVEFAAYVKQIYGARTALPPSGWTNFWRTILTGCRTDLFKTSNNCPFK